jgi:uncharacterized LabA/DUF88 family protein
MRVGVYIDGFNLYYGGRTLCGEGMPGWRWLDVRALVESRLPSQWTNASISRVVYCTARVSGVDDPTTPQDQDRYLRALELSGSVDEIAFGTFVARVRRNVLATAGKRGRPEIVTSQWPIMVKDSNRDDVTDARFMVSHLHREEKGSDVNLATHLLLDIFQTNIDAAVVVSNDSDLKLPIKEARDRVPVGIVTPAQRFAGDLAFKPGDGVGGHWQANLDQTAFQAHQLPDPVQKVPKPAGW